METTQYDDLLELLAKAGSDNEHEAREGLAGFSQASQTSIRDMMFPDELFQSLFYVVNYDDGEDPRYITDIVQPGKEGDYVAYSTPEVGEIPKNFAQPNSFTVPTNIIRSNVTIPRKILRKKQYNAVARVVRALVGGLNAKLNQLCFSSVLATGIANGNIQFVQADAVNSISKTLIRNLKIRMQRGGGKFTSQDDFMLRDTFLSPEAHSSLVELDNTKLDEQTRRDVIMDENGYLPMLMGVRFHSWKEFGVGSDFQALFAALGGTMPGSPAKTEILVGTDRTKKSFELAVTLPPFIEEDVTAANRNEASWLLTTECAGIVLDNRAVRLGAC